MACVTEKYILNIIRLVINKAEMIPGCFGEGLLGDLDSIYLNFIAINKSELVVSMNVENISCTGTNS